MKGTGTDAASTRGLESSSQKRSGTPHNASGEQRNEDRFEEGNSESKGINPYVFPLQKTLRPASFDICEDERKNFRRNDEFSPGERLNLFQNQSLARNIGKRNPSRSVCKSDRNVNYCDNKVWRDDVESDAESENDSHHSATDKHLKNSLINMKSNTTEEEDPPVPRVHRMLSVHRMPSVNIRPEFIIQAGPKINIAPSTLTLKKPNRKNVQFFDVVYPSTNESTPRTEIRRKPKTLYTYSDFVCERHAFPSGKLVRADEANTASLDGKKSALIDLIQSVSNKIEKGEKVTNCCQLTSSLPVLASVVSKMEVKCAKDVDLMTGYVDRLLQLMRKELGSKEEHRCCQLHETVQYQIVELELMQSENHEHQ